jgi:hypothetical protein
MALQTLKYLWLLVEELEATNMVAVVAVVELFITAHSQ